MRKDSPLIPGSELSVITLRFCWKELAVRFSMSEMFGGHFPLVPSVFLQVRKCKTCISHSLGGSPITPGPQDRRKEIFKKEMVPSQTSFAIGQFSMKLLEMAVNYSVK